MDTPIEREGRFAFKAYIDALTGQILAAWDGSRSGSIGGGPTKKKHVPFGWDLGPVPISLSSKRKTVSVTGGKIDRSRDVPVEKEYHRVILQIGKVSLNCRFYSKSNLLGITRDTTTTFGRPNKEVLRGLRKLTGRF